MGRKINFFPGWTPCLLPWIRPWNVKYPCWNSLICIMRSLVCTTHVEASELSIKRRCEAWVRRAYE